jgi:hypothetical protein
MAKPRFVGSNQTRGFRQVGTYPISQDNTQVVVDLPRGPHIESAVVRLTGNVNVTTLFTAVRNEATARFLRRADWVLNSNVTMDSVSGHQILASMVQTRRNRPTNTNPTAAAVASYPVVGTWVFDRAIMDMMRPKDSMLKTDVGISNNQLRLQWGALSDFFTGAGVAAYVGMQASVYVTDYQEMRDADGKTPEPAWYAKRNGLFVTLSGAGNGQQVKLNTGNRLRSLSIRVLNATTQEPDATLVTRIRVQRAGDTRVDMVAADLLALNQATFGQALLTGQYIVDFANTGQLGVRYSEFWPIPSSADTFLLVDTTAACILDISSLEGVDLISAG